MRRLAILALAAAVAPAAGGAAAATPAASVTYLAGEASRRAAGAPEPLAVGSAVYADDLLETRTRTRLELTLVDRSVLRLGPRSRVRLTKALFGATAADREVAATIAVGSVWAKVTRALAGGRFEVRTSNAVAGVRGTTFRVDARADRSCVVKVYSGAVAVAGGALPPSRGQPDGGSERRQVPGPEQVTREQWERLVGRMMEIAVAPDGSPSEPRAFALARPGKDAWEDWNRERDAREP